MFLPIGDRPNPPQTPWVTWTLMALNIAVHLVLWPLSFQPADLDDPTTLEYLDVLYEERQIPAQTLVDNTSRGDIVRYVWGSKPSQLSLLTMLTSMFLHGGLMHLVGNMLFLWIFGDNIEHRMGRGMFLLAYLGTGFAAALGDTLLRMDSSVPAVGASGAISGVLGLYFLWFPHNRVQVFVFLFPLIMQTIELPARFVLGMYLVLDNLLPLLLTGGAGGVSYGAHIGGFVAGMAWAWRLNQQIENPRSPRRQPKEKGRSETGRGGPPPPPAQQDLPATLDQLIGQGRLDEAARLFLQTPRPASRLGVSAPNKLRLAEALAGAGMARPALAVMQRLLADHPRGPERVRAHLGAAQILLHAFASPTAAYQHVYSALEDDPTPEEAAVARELLQELEAQTGGLPRTPWN